MEFSWPILIFTLLLLDSLGAIVIAWCGRRWWLYHTGTFGTYFPPAKGWSVLYLGLVLYIGYLLGVFPAMF